MNGYPKDVSPKCASDTSLPHANCDSASFISAYNGAHKKYLYSAVLLLNGVPSPYGYSFTWNGGQRNRSAFLPDTATIRLRSIMYSYGMQNTYPCFDNAPTPAEGPVVVTCNGYPFTYYPFINDIELDSLDYQWSPVLDSLGNALPFSNGHSYINPLPGPADNPNNTSPQLNLKEGSIAFTSYSTGGYFATQKITSFKCGIRMAEIHRDMYFLLDSCGPVNMNFNAPLSGNNNLYFDTLYASELAKYNLNFSDSLNLNSGNIHMTAWGQQFGDYIPTNGNNPPIFDTTIGCLNPPCASLNPAPSDSIPLSDSNTITTQFRWQTDCGHIATVAGCGNTDNNYSFYFKYWNDHCPFPAVQYGKLKINVSHYPFLLSPFLDSLHVDSTTGDISIFWKPVADSGHIFIKYGIFSSTQYLGPYYEIDSLYNVLDSSYTHIGADGLNTERHYFVITYSGCNPNFILWHPALDTLGNFTTPVYPDTSDIKVVTIWNPALFSYNFVYATIKNVGQYGIDTVEMSYYQPDSTLVEENYIGHMNPGDSVVYLFQQVAIPSVNPQYQLCVRAKITYDSDTTNDTHCIQTSLGLNEAISNQFQVLPNIPNPAKNYTAIRFIVPNSGDAEIKIYNIAGGEVIKKTTHVKTGENGVDIDLSNYESGIYFYKISFNGESLNSKFVVIH